MWIIYVILAFLLLSIIAKVQEYNSQKKEKEERENRIRKNVQTGAFDCKKEIFHNLYIINTGGKSSVSCPLKPSDSAPLC